MKENSQSVTVPCKEKTTETPVSCAVIQDLMPLVQDGVASPESEALVKTHIKTCPDCRALWEALPASPAPQSGLPDDDAVLRKVRLHVRLWLLVVIVVGLTLGMTVLFRGITGLIFVFFPLTCGIAYWFDDVIWKLVPLLAGVIVALAFLPDLVSTWHNSTFLTALYAYLTGVSMPVLVLVALCLLGALTAFLLRYAVKGRGKTKG